MRVVKTLLVVVCAAVMAQSTASGGTPLGTAFTYQGQLKQNGSPMNGTVSLRFSLFDAPGSGVPPTGGNQIGATQTLTAVPVANGIFTARLNGGGEFGASAFNGDARWIQIAVCEDVGCAASSILSPRQAISAAPYAAFSTAPWMPSAAGISYSGGRVGIGTNAPGAKLDVRGTTSDILVSAGDLATPGGNAGFLTNFSAPTTHASFMENGIQVFSVAGGGNGFFAGNVGIGTPTSSHSLSLNGGMNVDGGDLNNGSGLNSGQPGLNFGHPNSGEGIASKRTFGGNRWGLDFYTNNLQRMTITNAGNVGIGTTTPGAKLEVLGLTKTQCLVITGGCDLAEPFAVSTSRERTRKVEPGMVMVIDPEHPGQLKLSGESYDRKVAGVISGARGLKAGMILQADDATEVRGDHPVALTGRVWCWCDASYGAIAPGDLLTTSDTPGHAMRVSEHSRAQGAVLGKAMTRLGNGRGLVLALVTLQ